MGLYHKYTCLEIWPIFRANLHVDIPHDEAAGTGTRLIEGATTTNQSKTATTTSTSASWSRWWMCNWGGVPNSWIKPEKWGWELLLFFEAGLLGV